MTLVTCSCRAVTGTLGLAGKRLDEVAPRARKLPNSLEDAADTVLWLVENGGCGGIYSRHR